MKKMMRSTFGRLFNKNWVLAATTAQQRSPHVA